MNALKIHVERIVRPIRASVKRKNRMREELLAHLIAGYKDERKEMGSDEEAIEQVIERLGAVEAVRRDLETTVPKLESIGCIRILPGMDAILRNEKRSGESTWRYAARGATYIAVFLTPVIIIASAGSVAVEIHEGMAWKVSLNKLIETLPLVTGLLACLWVSFFVPYVLFDRIGIRARCSPESGTPAMVKACIDTGLWLFIVALFFALILPFTYATIPINKWSVLVDSLMIAVKAVPWYAWILVPSLFMFMVTLSAAFDRRQYVEWTHIDIEE